jgi:hypothetical protein
MSATVSKKNPKVPDPTTKNATELPWLNLATMLKIETAANAAPKER